jgi:hypothetical protein
MVVVAVQKKVLSWRSLCDLIISTAPEPIVLHFWLMGDRQRVFVPASGLLQRYWFD